MTMAYTTKTTTDVQDKKYTRKITNKGNMQAAMNQLMRAIQFFLVLNMLIREKASLKS
jgi:hypothetical protein